MKSRKRLRPLKFSLFSLIALVTCSALVLGFYRNFVIPQQQQHLAAADLAAKGAKLEYRRHGAVLHFLLSIFLDAEARRDCIVVHAERSLITNADLELLAKMPRVEKLYLASTSITDDGIRHLRHVPMLRRLSLWNTNVSNRGLKILRELKHLEALDIHNTTYPKFGTTRPDVTTSKTSAPTQLTPKCLEHLRGHRTLAELNMSMKLNQAGLEALSSIPRLKIRSLRLNGISDVGMAILPRWPDLQSLRIRQGRFQAGGLANIRKLPALNELRLEQCTGDADNWQQLQHPNVRFLSLAESNITDEGVALLGPFPNLLVLDLIRTGSTSNCIQHLLRMPKLKTLSLACALDDRSLGWLSQSDIKVQTRSIDAVLGLPKPLRLYVTDVGLGHLTKLPWITNAEIYDASSRSRRLDTQRPSSSSGKISDAGLADVASSNRQKQQFKITGKEITAAGLNVNPVGPSSRTVLKTEVDPDQLFREPVSKAFYLEISRTETKFRVEQSGVPHYFEIKHPATDDPLMLLRYFPNVTQLLIKNTGRQRGGMAWDELRHLHKLEDLSGGQLDGKAIARLAQMRTLKKLTATVSEISVADFESFAQIQTLETLEIRFTNVTSEHIDVIGKLNNLVTLRVLYAFRAFPEPGCKARGIANLTKLQTLMFSPTITDEDIAWICRARELRKISIAGEGVSIKGLRQLCSLPNIQGIDARPTGVTDDELSVLAREQWARDPRVSIRTDR